MEILDRKKHWEEIYTSKNTNQLGWFQKTPQISLNFFKALMLPKSTKIIDVGGGDSLFVDHLLNLDYSNVTVLDISSKSIEKAKRRLGENSSKVKWIVADASCFKPPEKYHFWHDRAAFHFLTKPQEIIGYKDALKTGLLSGGSLVIGTFSTTGPTKCSGIDIQQYSKESMMEVFKDQFQLEHFEVLDHITPSGSSQNFLFCSFRKIS